MLDFGKNFTTELISNRNVTFRLPIVLELIGDVGAGKTTFVRGLAEGLGIKKPVTSPSFTISKSYALKNGGRLIHYDFYRLQDPGLMADDLEENLKNPTNIIVIEWGESITNILPANRTTITIKKTDDNFRKITIKNNQDTTLQDISQPTKSKLAKSTIATNTTKHVKKNNIQLFLDTSSPETILRLNNKEYKHNFGHDLAEKLLGFIHEKLQENHKTWQDITEIVFMSGPGSFTGLRIGATIVNTLAHELNIPLYDHHGTKHQIIIPEYGRPANISKPRK